MNYFKKANPKNSLIPKNYAPHSHPENPDSDKVLGVAPSSHKPYPAAMLFRAALRSGPNRQQSPARSLGLNPSNH